MTEPTIDQTMQLAVQNHKAGRIAEAERLYREVLSRQPGHPDALHLLGVIAKQAGQLDTAIELIKRAIAVDSTIALYHNNLGNALRDQGLIDEAIAAYRQAIVLKPSYADAYYNLGNSLRDRGLLDEAIAAYHRAIEFQPGLAEAQNSLGIALRDKGLFDEAIVCLREAIRLKPGYARAHVNLGLALRAKGQDEQAIAAYRDALKLNPESAEAYNNLGIALRDRNQLDEAVAALRQAILIDPGSAEAHNNLGNALWNKGLLDEAVASIRQAIRLKPKLAEAHNSLGIALRDKGQIDEAISAFRQAVRLNPDLADAQTNLGNVLTETGLLDEAVATLREAIRLNPELPGTYNNLGNALKDQGNLDEAITCFDRAVALAPHNPALLSNRLYSIYFHPRYTSSEILTEHLRWEELHGKPLRPFIKPHANDRDPNRLLRVGYVSPDFRAHPVGRFMLPLLGAHDHAHFEIFCYSSVVSPDHFTQRIQACADTWRDIRGISHEKAAELVRQDRVDILVDLTMHMAKNHMPLFARKPAPVQTTYLAYAGTTGLKTIDYRITDPHLDPPGSGDEPYAEKSISIESYWCYQPPIENLPTTPLPSAGNGPITFGCLNNFCKITPATLQTWCELLAAVPNSRLLLHAADGSHRQQTHEFLRKSGIDHKRLAFAGRLQLPVYMEEYRRIDIGLDPFPYVGGTTTCDALWMGVPVITLRGNTAISRGGVSILTNIGLTELIADSTNQYVQIASELANDLSRLSHLRLTLRQQMQQSPLMNAPRFARSIESAYSRMWRTWCEVS